MQYVEGMLYLDSKFTKGYLGFEDGIITDATAGSSPDPDKVLAKGVVLPLLTNYHIHIGDAIARGSELPHDLEQLVAPPDGIKFQILANSSPAKLCQGMRNAALEMLAAGTLNFCDFRETGVEGVRLLKEAVRELPLNAFIMGRPGDQKFSKEELNELLPMVDGLGLSSISDWDYSELEKVARTVKQNGKLFALHASERTREDLDKILDLQPDFIVHMTKGTDADFEKLAEVGIPVVLCPRSNIFFDQIPNISKMLDHGVTLVLGTDNAMITTCNLFDELRAGFELANRFDQVSPLTMLAMITKNLKKILNPKYHISLSPGSGSNFMVIDIPLEKPENIIVKGITPEMIKLIQIGTNVWKQ